MATTADSRLRPQATRTRKHHAPYVTPGQLLSAAVGALTTLSQLTNSYPLAQTTSDITAGFALGSGGVGGGILYQFIYPATGGNDTETAAIIGAFTTVFADLSAQDEQLRQKLNATIVDVNTILTKLQQAGL